MAFAFYNRKGRIEQLADPLDRQTLNFNWIAPVAELAAETGRIVRRLVAGPTFAYGETKALVNRTFERALTAQLAAEAQAFARCARTRDLAEGVTAFGEKRKPDFKGR